MSAVGATVPGPARAARGPLELNTAASIICKPDLCNFVCNVEQYCKILAISAIYKNSCNMYNMYNINLNVGGLYSSCHSILYTENCMQY